MALSQVSSTPFILPYRHGVIPNLRLRAGPEQNRGRNRQKSNANHTSHNARIAPKLPARRISEWRKIGGAEKTRKLLRKIDRRLRARGEMILVG